MAKRRTRQIRVYEETTQLIEQLVRVSQGKTFSDVAEDIAKLAYPETYDEILRSNEEIQKRLKREAKD